MKLRHSGRVRSRCHLCFRMAHSFHPSLLDSRLDGRVIAPRRHSGEGRNPETACNTIPSRHRLPPVSRSGLHDSDGV